ncbi:MAG: DUF92 domain-containing protein [Bacteroidota bacterium]
MNKKLIVSIFVCTSALGLVLLALYLKKAFLPTNLAWGLLGISLFVVLSALSGKIDHIGALCGGMIALYIFLGTGFTGLLLLLLFFAGGSFASHWKKREKAQEGLEQENKGKRTYTHALANGGVAAICGLLAWLFPEQQLIFQHALAGSFAAAMADTLSSELGNVYGSKYWNILTWRKEPKGLDGVISWEGSLAGLMGSFFIGGIYVGVEGSGWGILSLLVLAGLLGGIVDSVLGATLQRKGYLSNGMVNFWNTAFGAGFVYIFW